MIDFAKENNEKLLRMEQLLLNEADGLLKGEAVRALCGDSDDEKEQRRAVALLIAYAFGLDPEQSDEDREFLNRWMMPSIKRFSPTAFKENSYYRQVKFPHLKEGNVELTQLRYEPFQLFPAGELEEMDDGRLRAPIGWMDKEFGYPALLQGGREWMALKPNEIITMEEPLGHAWGRVLVMGLGLGYFAYMASEKETTEQVTIVERDEGIIELFRKHLLPQFGHAEKVEIVQADAVEYSKSHYGGKEYDYVFVDLWHDVSDGLDIYRKMKELEWDGHPHTDYWIEQTMKVYLG